MLRTAKVALATLTVAVSVLTSPSGTTATAQAAEAPASYADQMEAAVVKYTNAARRAHGKRPVRAVACESQIANRWSARLRRDDGFYHQDLHVILRRCGGNYASENLAKYPVQQIPAEEMAKRTVRLWLDSTSGHRENLLSSRVRAIGVGVRKSSDGDWWIVTQDFGN